MKVVNSDKFIKIIADEGNKITNANRDFFSDYIYLSKNDSQDNYEEVGREIWKYFIEDPNPDIVELQAQTEDINDTMDIMMTALADSDERNNTTIDVILLAIDDLYTMLETIILKGGE